MAILRSHHIAVRTPDLARAEKFYTEVLGLKVSGRLELPDTQIAFIDLGGTRLELIEDKSRTEPMEEGRKGLSHVAMEVDDVFTTAEALKKKGVTFHMGPVSLGELSVAFFRDPDGVELELFQGQV